jgi:hypothetical protein
MGLDIKFGNLADALEQLYSSTGDPSILVRNGRKVIKAAIQKQVGHPVSLAEKRVPRELRDPIRFGNYFQIHVLRAYASRVAGYTLEKAYSIPELYVSASSAVISEPKSTVETQGTAEDEIENEIQQLWKIRLDDVVPLAQPRITPFPYQQLVCFSDTEGLYLPVDFPVPLVLDGLHIGSSVMLLRELRAVQRCLHRTNLVVSRRGPKGAKDFVEAVRLAWMKIHRPCQASAKGGWPLVFV